MTVSLFPTPQRLDKVMAILHYRLLFDDDVQDYRFIIDPTDHHHILRDGLPQLAKLNGLLRGNVKFCFDPVTGSLVISNMSDAVLSELRYLLLSRMRDSMAASDPTVDIGLVRGTLAFSGLEDRVPQCLVVLYPSGHNGTPSFIVNCRVASGKQDEWAAKRSENTHIMTENPGIQTMSRLDFRGFTSARFINDSDRERRMKRIADLSEVVTWTRNKDGEIVGSIDKLSKKNGELCLRILGGGNNEETVVSEGTKVVIKYTEILDVVRRAGGWGPLGAIPRAPTSGGMEASVLPLFPLHRRLLAPTGSRIDSFPGSDMAARAARFLNLGGTTTPTNTVLGAHPFGPTYAAVHGCLGGGANQNLAGGRAWNTGVQLLRRLLRR
ncbi:hypothetical protein B0T25DRAFT_595098 [Lasiosphaeria hispida]|uniref:Uncharacterized protein n=1 Tax=Lasiosphaeria hispida TaxID=260671 RepID=A0AAJ0MJD1_9PEZI|nr:hypothetical protein B0T25DRAFT_595098 [Lasiosphaeria hispida]